MKTIVGLFTILLNIGINKDGAFGRDLNKYIVTTITAFVGILVVAWVIKTLIVYPNFGVKLLWVLFTIGVLYLNKDYLLTPFDLD